MISRPFVFVGLLRSASSYTEARDTIPGPACFEAVVIRLYALH
jgi:hypothetical protein